MRWSSKFKNRLSSMKMSRALFGSLLLVFALTSGCAPTLRESLNRHTLKSSLGGSSSIHVDVVASEIRWEEPISLKFEPAQLRGSLASAIQDVLSGPNKRATRVSDSTPTRFLLEVHRLHHSYTRFFFPCLFYFSFFGCPVDTITAEISLTLDYRGEFFKASASGQATFNYFQYGMGAHPPEVRAVGVALSEALKMISRSVHSPRDGQNGGQ